MPSVLDLSRKHQAGQVESAAQVQALVDVAFRKTLNPRRLDQTAPDYYRAALAVLAVGYDNAANEAFTFYNDARQAVGRGALNRGVLAVGAQPFDARAALVGLRVTGPVAVKKQIASGVGLQAAITSARKQTMAYGLKATMNGSRRALRTATKNDADALGWARVSDGQPCKRCAMLLSRGPVYKSEDTARFKFHDGCGCGVRPWFKGDADGGWSPDSLALRDLWQTTQGAKALDIWGNPTPLKTFPNGKQYRESVSWSDAVAQAYSTPGHAVFETVTDKIARTVAVDAQRLAREAADAAEAMAVAAARTAREAERIAQRAAEKVAREEAERLAKEAAEARAKAALEKKWRGKPKPAPPAVPPPPAPVGAKAFDAWLDKAKARFTAHAKSTGSPKTDLTKSLNWSHFRRVVDDHDVSALDYLKSNHYIDDALYREALDAMKAAKAFEPGAEAVYKKALRSYKNRQTRYKRYLQEWRDVNGVTGADLTGMDGFKRFRSNDEAVRWANETYTKPSGKGGSALRRYTGGDYGPWNSALRSAADRDNPPSGSWRQPTIDADSGLQPNPEAVIVNRGTSFLEFDLGDGKRVGSMPPPDPMSLIGSVHTQHGYYSTSMGETAAFGGEVKLKLAVPKDYPVSWAMPYSKFTNEREMILGRSTNFYIHNVYRNPNGSGWVVEAEVLPRDIDPADLAGVDPMPSTEAFTR